MGTLDDAIREHLELKRKQGASAEELERKEAEALGHRSAVPEPPAAAPPPPADAEPEPAAADSAHQPEEPALRDQPDVPDVPAGDPETAMNGASAAASEPAPPDPPAPAPPASDDVDLFDQDVLSTSTPDEPVVRRTSREPEPDPEPDGEEAEDFLEDTPDFLEETPEHDRLWFEQKPPKDFDFD